MFRKTTLLCVAAVAVLMMVGSAHAQTIVYQDNYDGDGIETNAGIGGGAVSMNTSPSSVSWAEGWWIDDGNLTMGGNGGWGGISGGSYSQNGFDLSSGFTLEVTYNALSSQDRFTMGLMETAGTEDRDTTGTMAWPIGYLATSGSSTFKGIYFNAFAYDSRGRYPDAPGLQLADGTGMVQLSDEQARNTGEHTLVLEMDDASNWSYSIDGAAATTGTIEGDGFDYSKKYHFITRNQPRRASQIIAVTLSIAMAPQPGDFNLDTQVEQTDLNLLLANWGATTVPAEWTATFDGLVDQSELNDLLANWGAGVPGAESLSAAETVVPEPATLGLLLIGGLAAVRRRKA